MSYSKAPASFPLVVPEVGKHLLLGLSDLLVLGQEDPADAFGAWWLGQGSLVRVVLTHAEVVDVVV